MALGFTFGGPRSPNTGITGGSARGSGLVVRQVGGNKFAGGGTLPATSSPSPAMMPPSSAPGFDFGSFSPPMMPLPAPNAGGGGEGTDMIGSALAGLRSAMQPPEMPAEGVVDGPGRALNPSVGRRTPPAASRILSQLSRIY